MKKIYVIHYIIELLLSAMKSFLCKCCGHLLRHRLFLPFIQYLLLIKQLQLTYNYAPNLGSSDRVLSLLSFFAHKFQCRLPLYFQFLDFISHNIKWNKLNNIILYQILYKYNNTFFSRSTDSCPRRSSIDDLNLALIS